MTGEPHPTRDGVWLPVAGGPEELDAAWLSGALGRDVSSVAAERIGTGQTGAAYRLSIDSVDGPLTLIAKVAAGDPAARRRVRDGYRSEVGFYRHIASTVEVATPHCWYGAITADSLAFTLLLDDLSPRVPGVQAEGCTIDQARLAVSNLAALHAGRWNDESIFDLAFVARPTAAGAPARDLAYFLGTSLSIDDRRRAERDLVGHYHAALCERGVTHDEDECFDDYRLGQLRGPMVTTIGSAYATGERSDAADEMFLAMARRSCAAIRDLDSLAAVAGYGAASWR